LPEGRVAVGAGLGLKENPWIGTDKPILARIRERLEPPARLPDGPPLSRAEAARFRLHLADEIEEGYVATYEQPVRNADGTIATAWEETVVYGLRFSTPEAAARVRLLPESKRHAGVVGPFIAGVSGHGGRCFQAISAHVKSLRFIE
jgi:hypothetical protein